LARFLIQFPSEITERAFSATACGAFLITDLTPVTAQFYAADEMIAIDGSKEFIDTFKYYLDRPNERNMVIKKGLNRVFSEHTYFHRIDKLILFLDQNYELF